ncbi:MAG: YdeI/OmpD-associated family protein [Ktedonobacteraceae bacterium]|nr:YdeI/OmpD-associated family protein [Ktedonobacteraceae bacterium]
MEMFHGREVLHFDDACTWETWLATHHQKQEGIWLKIAKKSSSIPSVSYMEALDVALCYGWIDGQGKPYDEAYYLRKFTPRRSKSMWSGVNVKKVEVLVEAGRMREPGLKEIEAAKADGRWNLAYESQKNATVPPDFTAALEQNERAKSFFESLNKTNRYAFIWRITTAKKSELRRSRIQKCVAMLQEAKKLHE